MGEGFPAVFGSCIHQGPCQCGEVPDLRGGAAPAPVNPTRIPTAGGDEAGGCRDRLDGLRPNSDGLQPNSDGLQPPT